jgi:hypothetical protein
MTWTLAHETTPRSEIYYCAESLSAFIVNQLALGETVLVRKQQKSGTRVEQGRVAVVRPQGLEP